MAYCPVPSNITFTRSGDSVFENVTIWGKTCLNEIDITGEALFYENVTFEKDVIIVGNLDVDFLTTKISFDVGVGGTVFTADTRTDRVGIFTATPVHKFQFNSEQDNTVVITGLGTVGIGTTNPGVGVTALNESTQGKLSLDLETLSVRRNIYDSAGSHGANGAFLNRDEFGVRWVTFEPSFSEGIFVQDEGVYIPQVGAAQSFTVVNYVQTNSLGLGTDTTIPIPDPSNTTEIVRVQTQDLWGYVGTGDNASIYRMTNVGIGSSAPNVTLDVLGNTNITGILTVTQDATVGASLTVTNNTFTGGILTVGQDANVGASLSVTNNTFIGGILTVTGNTDLNGDLDVDGNTELDGLNVDGNTTLDATTTDGLLDINAGGQANTFKVEDLTNDRVVIAGSGGELEDDANLTFNGSTLDVGVALNVDGATTLNSTLDVDLASRFRGSVELDSTLIDVNGSVASGKTDYRLSSVGTGVSWRPPGVQTQNTIWVSKDGNDSNSGFLEGDAKATVGAAAAVALEGDTIKIRPGRYVENNPIGLRTDVSITGEDIRLVTIEPQNVEKDVFWVRRGCLIENLNFSGATIGVAHTDCGAVAFPITGQTANSGYTPGGPATQGSSGRWRSPYIRNCTNFMTKSIGMRINGNDAIGTPDGANLKSMVCDSFTQYNEAGIGVSLTNNAYAQLVSIFTINCDIGIFAGSGAQCDLTNSNSSFGNFGLVAAGLGSTQYTGKVRDAVIPGDNSDVVVGKGVTDTDGDSRRPFDGQAAYFKIDLDNYPDAVGTGRITAPLQELASIKILNGGSGFSQENPPDILIRDNDGTVVPKGPQGIIAEGSANVSAAGTITSIDVINSGRNYLPTQNIVVEVDGNTGLATAVMEPIYFTVSEATDNRSDTAGITTCLLYKSPSPRD